MHRRRFTFASAACALTAAALATFTGAASAQDFPSKPITFVVPYAAGGSIDALARLIGEKLSRRLGQPVVVENRAGAGTLIGTASVARAVPDGHTVLFAASALTIQPAVNKAFNVNVERDLAPVSELVRGSFVVASSANFAPKTLKEAIAFSIANPQAVSYGTPGAGTSPHLTGEYLKSRSGAQFLHVPYKGSSIALNATLANEVQFTIDPIANLKPQIDAGKLRGLAVTSSKRSPLLPNVPTVVESGIADFDVSYWMGTFAPAGTPQPVVARLSREIATIIREPDVTRRLQELGFDPVGSTPEEFTRRVHDELVLWKKLVAEQKIAIE